MREKTFPYLIGIICILSILLYFNYSNVDKKVSEVEDKLEKVQEERDELKNQLNETESQLSTASENWSNYEQYADFLSENMSRFEMLGFNFWNENGFIQEGSSIYHTYYGCLGLPSETWDTSYSIYYLEQQGYTPCPDCYDYRP